MPPVSDATTVVIVDEVDVVSNHLSAIDSDAPNPERVTVRLDATCPEVAESSIAFVTVNVAEPRLPDPPVPSIKCAPLVASGTVNASEALP